MSAGLEAELLERLRQTAQGVGLLHLGVADLADPRLATAADALDDFLDRGAHGDMDFLERTRDLRRDPRGLLPDARSVLVAAAPYGGEAGPIARYARYFDYHTDLHRRMEVVEAELLARLPGVGTRICVDTKPLMERALAVCAGVGVLGKHGCLIVPGLGSWVVLACLLTTAAPPGSATPRASLPSGRDFTVCGSCTRCLDACPTAAFEGPGRLDARRCISYLTIEHRGAIAPELAQRLGVRIAGCDVCQDVCPWNASDSREARAPPQAWLTPPPRGFREVDLTKIAAFGSSPHRSFVRSTPLMRISRRQLRRNALAALGNLPGAPTTGEEAALAAAESDDDELLRTTAREARARRLHRG